MIISLLVAIDEGGTIGKENRLPWRLQADLQRFKRLTMGHHLIMGRKTYESIGRALPGRISIILTRDPGWRPKDCPIASCRVVSTLKEALDTARQGGETEVFVIGGRQVFEKALPLADRIYLTRVHAKVTGDVFFPDLRPEDWRETDRAEFPADDQNEYPFTVFELERR